MPLAQDLIGTVTVVDRKAIVGGAIIVADVEDLATGKTERWAFNAPASANSWSNAQLISWVRDAAISRMIQIQDTEIAATLAALREGKNPLRNSDGTTKGTVHLSYLEVASAIYRQLIDSQDPKDKVIGAQITQSLTDDEIAAITGLDLAGIQGLRDKATAAIQAATLMQLAGGSF